MARSYRRPHFVREESWRYKRVKTTWRSPRGKTSRVRRSKKGWPAVVKIGYSRPKTTRGSHPSGVRELLVWRPSDLENVDSKTQVVRIAHTVGESKRVLIIEEAKKRDIRILNPRLKKAEAEAVPAPEAQPTEAEQEAKAEEPAKPENAEKQPERTDRESEKGPE
jgi:large subunit ribosomal protein L32e